MQTKKILLVFLSLFFSVVFIFTSKVSAASSINRLGGNDRYKTSAQISQNTWRESNTIILVSGENFPDALSSAPLSKKYNAPILLTKHNSIDSSILQEIKRLNAKEVFIIGGTGAISNNVEIQLNSMNIKSIRISGKDRYDTSIKIAQIVGGDKGAFIVSGKDFPDAVSAAPIAALSEMPIILTASDKLPSTVKAFIDRNKNNKYYIIGGNASINNNVANEIYNFKRLGGQNRYETNTKVINEFANSIDFTNIYLANGQGFSDALSGSAAAGKIASPVILVSNSNLNNSIIKSRLDSIEKVNVLGGMTVISDALVHKVLNSKNIKVCLDPGHGGYDSGAVGPNGVLEKNVNLSIALKVGRILKEKGIDVIYTRTSDNVSWPSNEREDLQKRCTIANNSNAQYFVCIHANSASVSEARGAEVYYASGSIRGEQLAKLIQEEIIKETNLANRGIKTANFYVLKNTSAPAVLIETGFISNPTEEKLLNSNSFQEKMAQAIARGIIKFAEKNY